MWELWWTKRHWGRFSPSTSVSPANHSTNFSVIIITRDRHSRPISGRSVEWTQLDSTPHYTNSKPLNLLCCYTDQATGRMSEKPRFDPCRIKIFFYSPQRAEREWSPLRLSPDACRALLLHAESSRSMEFITHLHLVPGLSMPGDIPPLPHMSYGRKTNLLVLPLRTLHNDNTHYAVLPSRGNAKKSLRWRRILPSEAYLPLPFDIIRRYL
jgi:hypothetical protein